jgi:hypothetical protein
MLRAVWLTCFSETLGTTQVPTDMFEAGFEVDMEEGLANFFEAYAEAFGVTTGTKYRRTELLRMGPRLEALMLEQERFDRMYGVPLLGNATHEVTNWGTISLEANPIPTTALSVRTLC